TNETLWSDLSEITGYLENEQLITSRTAQTLPTGSGGPASTSLPAPSVQAAGNQYQIDRSQLDSLISTSEKIQAPVTKERSRDDVRQDLPSLKDAIRKQSQDAIDAVRRREFYESRK
ncbi:MAG: hypothetical protein KDA85_09120, partial [Planctomycetaceae bacterium]|nr:hypothetical protein [Planctomycetaceae bacterium]